MSSIIYSAPETEKPTLLTTELLAEILQKLPQGTRVCIFQEYEGNGGAFYVNYINYDATKNRIIINASGGTTSNNADEMDNGAGWYKSDSDDE